VSLNIPGEETEIAILKKGAIIGESCLVHKTFRTNCTAREFTEFLVTPLDELVALQNDDPVFATKFMSMIIEQMAKKIYDSNQKVRDILNTNQGKIDEAIY
jgi:CRP-like cAMP-binding protein